MRTRLYFGGLYFTLPLLGACSFNAGDAVSDGLFVGVSDTISTVLSTVVLNVLGLSA